MAVFAPLALAVALLTACEDDGTEPEEDPADAVASMRVVIGTTTVNINEGGTVTGGPVVIAAGAPTAISATFLDAGGAAVAGLEAEFQLTVTSANAALLTFTRTGVFAGTLTRLAAGTTTLRVALFHIGEQHEDFGPHSVTVTVQ